MNTVSNRKWLRIAALSLSFFSSFFLNVHAAQPSAAQIEQFRKLPRAQQQALAKQFGVDINALQSLQGGASNQAVNQPQELVRGDNQQFNRQPQVQQTQKFANEQSELRLFGYDVFANGPSSFTPDLTVAIPENYVLGAGDVLSIQGFGKESFDYQITVSREGQVIIPELGPFKVAGLSFADAKAFLKARIKERIIGVETLVSLSNLRAIRVFVLGEVNQPGPYTVNSLTSMTQVLFAAGGISDIGSLRNVQLKRSGKLIQSLDLYDLLIKGDSSGDALLKAGDVVFIPPVNKRVTVDGEVTRPAVYEFNYDEGFADVIAMAGGILPSGFKQQVKVERFNQDDSRVVLTLDMTDDKAVNSFNVKSGDAVHVQKSAELFTSSVAVVGAAVRPGEYQWHHGMKVTDIIANIDSHLLDDADLNYSIIVREVDLARNIEVLQFSLANAILLPSSKDNMELNVNDKIFVFSDVVTKEQELLDQNIETSVAQQNGTVAVAGEFKGSRQNLNSQALQVSNQRLNQSISDLANVSANEAEANNANMLQEHSRQRLLLPVIEKLRLQGGSGSPIQLFEIEGEVKFPGVYPLAVNSGLKQAIAAAGGINEAAYLANAEITRTSVVDGEAKKSILSFDLAKALSDSTTGKRALQSKDRIHVLKIPAWSENHVIELKGEFVFPGKYTIQRGETLSDIVKRAGGFTEYAFIEGSVFTREKLKELERENIVKLTESLRLEIASKSLTDEDFNTSYPEVQQILADLTRLEPVGRLVIDLAKVVHENSYDILLEKGDVLHVPSKKNSVNVIGQVQVTSSHVYDDQLTVEDYVKLSGGAKNRADVDKTYIVAANGSVRVLRDDSWFSSEVNQSLKPGDTIVVPLDADHKDKIKLWGTVSQILYSSALAVAAVNGL